jgi:DnaK suppressor protein
VSTTSSTAAPAAKPLTKKELQKFKELLEGKRRDVVDRARQTLTENMTLDPSDLPDEMDLASAEYTQSFEFRLRGRDKSLLSKLDLAIKKIDDGTFGNCESCDEPIGKKRLEAARDSVHPLQGRPGARRAHDGVMARAGRAARGRAVRRGMAPLASRGRSVTSAGGAA